MEINPDRGPLRVRSVGKSDRQERTRWSNELRENYVRVERGNPSAAAVEQARALAREIVDAFDSLSHEARTRVASTVTAAILALAREIRPSRSRQRVALALGAVGALRYRAWLHGSLSGARKTPPRSETRSTESPHETTA